MTMLYIVAEGQTEETFIEELLRPVLTEHGVVLMGVIVMEGNVRYGRIKSLVVKLLKEHPKAFCTTFIDFYGRGGAFPGEGSIGKFDSTAQKKKTLEDAFYSDVKETLAPRFDAARFFIPYVQMNEFEGLLFSDPEGLAMGLYKPELAPQLLAIRAQLATPEDINDNKFTAPSKRLLALYPGYDKPAGGTLAALKIGLDRIRTSCPLFNSWVVRLTQLEGLATEQTGDLE